MRIQVLTLLFVSLPALTQPVITCPSSVNQGTSVTCTSNVAVTWSLTGSGSLSTIDSTHASYTAPSHVGVQQEWGGCQVLPADHIYNTNISSLSINSNSATWLGTVTGGMNGGGNDFGINSVNNSTPTTSMSFFYTPANNGPFATPTLPYRKQEGGTRTSLIPSIDRHIMTVNYQNCVEQEMYQTYPVGLQASCPTCNSQSGISYSLSSYTSVGVVDAAGMLLGPLTYRWDEIENASINHAGRFTMASGFLQATNFLWPANSTTGGGPNTALPMGARIRLKSSFDCTILTNSIAMAFCTAFKNYGLILADVGGDYQFQVEQGPYSSAAQAAFDNILHNISSSNFDVVDESGLMVSSTSGLTTSPAVTISGTGTGGTGTAHPALVGVTIGTDTPFLNVQAGASAFQINYWLNGSSNTAVTWSLSGDGSLSSSGMYTPPATESVRKTATITLTSVADNIAILTIPITLLPNGVIRVNIGDYSTGDLTDSASNLWYGEFNTSYEIRALSSHIYLNSLGTFTSNISGLNTSDVSSLMNAFMDNYVPDYIYPIHVANGNYLIEFMDGIDNRGANQICSEFEAQGNIFYQYYDVAANGFSPYVAGMVSMTANVNNGILVFGQRKDICPATAMTVGGWTQPGYANTSNGIVGAMRVTFAGTGPVLGTSISGLTNISGHVTFK